MSREISFHPADLTRHYQKELWEIFLDTFYVATSYSEIEEHIARYKYESKREYVDIFVDLLAKLGDKYKIFSSKESLLVPVPMHWSRYFSRWFDHTGLIVDLLSKRETIPYRKILSTQWAKHQSKLSREKRLENKKNRFTMKNHILVPETVILFDDIISTWSTANECAKVLKAWGVKKVIGIFLASNF